MKTFDVVTIVTMTRFDTIEAESQEDAEIKADARYLNDPEYQCNIDEDLDDVEFEVSG